MERYTCHTAGASIWHSACGRFLVGRHTGTDEGWALRTKSGIDVTDVRESGILALELRWPTRSAMMEALSEVCRAIGVPEPGRLERRRDMVWWTLDGTIRLASIPDNPPDQRWYASVVSPSFVAIETRFPTRKAATEAARRRQRTMRSGPG